MSSKRNLISSQYLKPEKIPVSIIEIKDPATFVVKECPNLSISEEAEKFLEAEEMMQKFYDSIEPSFVQLPLKNTIVVVFVDKRYFRAQIRSILNAADGYIFKVYLLDYGRECTVPRSSLYEITQDFLQHPFQAVTFKLLDILPISLVMSPEDLTLSYGSVHSWDPSSVSHLQKLNKALDQAYIVVKGVEKDCLYGSLYMNLVDGKVICVNEDLVEKKFASSNSSFLENVGNRNSSTSIPKKIVRSSSESVKSFCSTDSGKTEKSNYSSKTLQKLLEIRKVSPKAKDEKEKVFDTNKQTAQRKMTGSMAVDVEKLNRQNKECNEEKEPKETLSPFSRFQNLLKNQSKSSEQGLEQKDCTSKSEENYNLTNIKKENNASSPKPKSLDKFEETGNLGSEQLNSLSLLESHKNLNNHNNPICQTTERQKVNEISRDNERTSQNFLASEQNIQEKKISTVKTQLPLAQEPSKVTPSKLDMIKKFLPSKKSISPSSSLSSTSEAATLKEEKKDQETLSQNSNQKSSDALKELIENMMSDVDDQDDILQVTLKQNKNVTSSSETDVSRYVNQ